MIEVTSSLLSDSLDDSIDPPILLDSLGRLRQQTPALNSRGLTHLFTGRSLDGCEVDRHAVMPVVCPPFTVRT